MKKTSGIKTGGLSYRAFIYENLDKFLEAPDNNDLMNRI